MDGRVKHLLVFSSAWLVPSMIYSGTYYPPRDYWYYINRVDTLLFIATITVGTLSTSGFGKKEITYKLTAYFFIVSIALFFLCFIRPLLP